MTLAFEPNARIFEFNPVIAFEPKARKPLPTRSNTDDDDGVVLLETPPVGVLTPRARDGVEAFGRLAGIVAFGSDDSVGWLERNIF